MLVSKSVFVLLIFAVFALLLLGLSSLIGWIVKLMFSLHRNYGATIGLVIAAIVMFIAIWGCTVGFHDFRIRKVEIAFQDLPKEFDGYRIVHFTDAHLGSWLDGDENMLTQAVDAMLAEQPDLIVFTGDIQNHAPNEIEPFMADLKRIKAKDGVYSVLGNHDYGYPKTKESPLGVRRLETEAGWKVLVNEHDIIRRDNDSIILAGMDNDGDGKHFPQRGDIKRALGISPNPSSGGGLESSEGQTNASNNPKASPEGRLEGSGIGFERASFIIMLEHDPTSWRRNILKNSSAQLTLSGHTHAMQFGLLGWSPSKWVYSEWSGLFEQGNQKIYVSSGLGGVVPFRFGMPGEIVVITLKQEELR